MRQLLLACLIITLIASCKKRDCYEVETAQARNGFSFDEVSYTADSFMYSESGDNVSVQSFANGGAIVNIRLAGDWPKTNGTYTYQYGTDTPQIQFIALNKYSKHSYVSAKCDTPTTAILVVNDGHWTLNMPLTRVADLYDFRYTAFLDLAIKN